MINSVGGYLSPERFEFFLRKLQGELSKYHFTSSTESNLMRLFSSLFDKVSFVNDAIKYPHHLEIVSAIVSNSNFLTDIIVQNPGLLYQLFDNDYLMREEDNATLTGEIYRNITPFKSFNSKLNYLKQFKKRYILKTGLNDILGFKSLESVTAQLSSLASTLLTALFDICRDEIEYKYKITIPHSYCLASLGKQGGNELNYSSDVDLILFYENDFPLEGEKEYREILIELIRLFIKSSSEVTEKGYLYRIDFRLRPDGRNAPLCGSIADYMNYYEARGEDWERQMLIKLNYVCGSRELYNFFYGYIRGFIFPSSHYLPVKEQIRKIKKDIERKNAGAENIKLFKGGIRDIEFTVQALQLLNGGRIKELRNGNSLESISLLEKHNLLKKQEASLFRDAYIFYRRTEHFLQLMNDRQTHLIPDDSEMQTKIAVYLGLKDAPEFQSLLEEYRTGVRKIYNRILKEEENTVSDPFEEISFKDRQRAEKNIRFLRSGSGLLESKGFESKTIDDFKSIEEQIATFLKTADNPDTVIDNFARVIKASAIPSLWYKRLKEKKYFLAFMLICASSKQSVDLITSSRQTEDYFISGGCFEKINISSVPSARFSNLLLCLTVQHSIGKLEREKFSLLLSQIIDIIIADASAGIKTPFFIASLGSYGAGEMNFASDIDFIFVAGDGCDVPEAEKEYSALLQTLNSKIGFFGIDLKLRPEGKNSQIIHTLSGFKKYLADRARIWEFQSFSKMRFTAGSRDLYKTFVSSLLSGVKKLSGEGIKKEMPDMHKKYTAQSRILYDGATDLKKNAGGLTTIEFALQFILLTNPAYYKACMGKSSLQTIKFLAGKGIYKDELQILSVNYGTLKNILMRHQNLHGSRNYRIEPDSSEAAIIKEIMKQNLSVFNKILED